MTLPRKAEFNGVRSSWEMYRTYDFFDSINAYWRTYTEVAEIGDIKMKVELSCMVDITLNLEIM